MFAGGTVSAAAQSGPVFTFTAPRPVVGSQLSDSSFSPSIVIFDSWKVSTPNGISSASVQDVGGTCGGCTVWTYSGGADKTAGSYTSSFPTTNGIYQLDGQATDGLGNTISAESEAVWGGVRDSSGFIYSSGWRVSHCSCYTGGTIRYSTRPGATATTHVGHRSFLASFVSDETGGRVALTFGGHTTDVTLSGAAEKNRVVVANIATPSGVPGRILTIKVLSGRVDVEAELQRCDGC